MSRREFFRLVRTLRTNTSGINTVELALALPFMLASSFGAIEVANMVRVHMRINQIAISLADNASRMKQETISGAPKIREFDANQALTAATHQGADLKLAQNGRIILSSLVTNGSGGQWIQWQRCTGAKVIYTSSYGLEGAGKTGTAFKGMGPSGGEIKTETDAGIMFAEVVYEYQPLVLDGLLDDMVIRKYKAVYVRDDRDLSGNGIWNLTPTVTVSNC